MVDGFVLVIDIVLIFFELIGESVLFVEMMGCSYVKVFRGELVYLEDDVIGMEVVGNVVLYKGDYKIICNVVFYGDFIWCFYNLLVDFGEIIDFFIIEFEVFVLFKQDYKVYVDKMGVFFMLDDFDQLK